jgi:hypothetical protein
MATLVATVGAANANSYLTNAEAEVLLEQTPVYSVWDTKNPTEQDNALMEATRLLDEYVDWNGKIAGDTQALRWPRSEVTDPDGRAVLSTVVPTAIKTATALFAAELLSTDRQLERDDTGIRSVGVAGAVSVTFDKTDKKKVIPERVRSVVRPYGNIAGWSAISRVVRG